MNGHFEITRLLITSVTSLQTPTSPPPIRRETYHTAIEMSSCAGHAHCVSYLLDALHLHHNTTPSPPCLLTSLEFAVQSNHVEVVRVLISRCDVDVGFRDGMMVREAAARGFVEMVRYLVEEVGVDPGVGGNGALKWAAFHGHGEVVKVLLGVPSLRPWWPDNEALRWASLMKRVEVVELLQQDPRMSNIML
ncbi:ankyrin repeat-containing domain protein [Chytridium lagenaria]|nr:ankyrin repeat-containing domain protein [Chytridium lagenaria]